MLPWLVITILSAQFTFSPRDAMTSVFHFRSGNLTSSYQVFSSIASINTTSYVAIITSSFCFVISLALFTLSFVSRFRFQSVLSAGILALISAFSWIFAIESLKYSLIASTSASGVFGQFTASIMGRAVTMGYGVCLVLAAGVLGIVIWNLKNR
jgi:hypothetical protein